MTLAKRPPKAITRAVGRAVADYRMISDGDWLLLALSGGKDSLSLLHTLIYLRTYAPVSFDLGAATVDPQIDGFDPSPLQHYTAELDIPYVYCSEPIMARAQTHMQGDSFCSFCSRMRRGILYTTARDHGYNVLVLAQHLDDLAESFLMSAFHRGRLETMKAHYLIDAGDLRVIRPFAYVRERQTAHFASAAGLPVIADNCPACFRMPTQRRHMKALLAQEERQHKHLFANLLRTMRPLMGEPPTPDSGTQHAPLRIAG
jgi:tRNA(Ile)-lysidine synthase TilS/MesJ